MSRAITKGRCLCGGVRVEVANLRSEISACYCTNCTRFGGGLQMFIEAAPATVTIEGTVKTHRSTPFSERAWCDTCGSPIWLRDIDPADAVYELSPGLFENAGGARLTRVVYADRHPEGFWLEGADVNHVSKQDYEAQFQHVGEVET